MEAELFLADAASVSEGKVGAIGMGWTTTQSPAGPFALVAFLRLDADRIGERLTIAFDLYDLETNQPCVNENGQAIRAEGWVQIDAGASMEGLQYETPVALTMPAGLTLKTGVYEWRLTLDGEHLATRPFGVLGESAATSVTTSTPAADAGGRQG